MTKNNPCARCSIGQRCCADMGLKISNSEFEKKFLQHSSKLSIIKYKKMFIVYPKDKTPCPYWSTIGCAIYENRPIDCQLYPYVLHRMVEKRNQISILLHDQSDCPLETSSFMPIDEAKGIIEILAREVYGDTKRIEIKYEPGKKPPRAFGIFDPLVARMSKSLRTYRLSEHN